MAEMGNCRPSSFIEADEYTRYCLDEACAYIQAKRRNGKEPNFNKNKKKKLKQRYTSFTDYYKDCLE